jgi:hypothetical protein
MVRLVAGRLYFRALRGLGGSARGGGGGTPLPRTHRSSAGVYGVGPLRFVFGVAWWLLLLLYLRRGWGHGVRDVRRALLREVAQRFDQEPGIEGLECLVLEQMLAVIKQRLEARPLELYWSAAARMAKRSGSSGEVCGRWDQKRAQNGVKRVCFLHALCSTGMTRTC